jgi:hypothetical protein
LPLTVVDGSELARIDPYRLAAKQRHLTTKQREMAEGFGDDLTFLEPLLPSARRR